MSLRRLAISQAATRWNGDGAALTAVLHEWIRKDVLPEPMIDVVDYGHVKGGPSVLFVGHESDYVIALGADAPTLTYQRKRAPGDGFAAHLADGIARARRFAALLSGEARTGLAFGEGPYRIELLDRLRAPNDAASFDALAPEIARTLRAALGREIDVTRVANDARAPLTVRVG